MSEVDRQGAVQAKCFGTAQGKGGVASMPMLRSTGDPGTIQGVPATRTASWRRSAEHTKSKLKKRSIPHSQRYGRRESSWGTGAGRRLPEQSEQSGRASPPLSISTTSWLSHFATRTVLLGTSRSAVLVPSMLETGCHSAPGSGCTQAAYCAERLTELPAKSSMKL